jgi:hypothetical protein
MKFYEECKKIFEAIIQADPTEKDKKRRDPRHPGHYSVSTKMLSAPDQIIQLEKDEKNLVYSEEDKKWYKRSRTWFNGVLGRYGDLIGDLVKTKEGSKASLDFQISNFIDVIKERSKFIAEDYLGLKEIEKGKTRKDLTEQEKRLVLLADEMDDIFLAFTRYYFLMFENVIFGFEKTGTQTDVRENVDRSSDKKMLLTSVYAKEGIGNEFIEVIGEYQKDVNATITQKKSLERAKESFQDLSYKEASKNETERKKLQTEIDNLQNKVDSLEAKEIASFKKILDIVTKVTSSKVPSGINNLEDVIGTLSETSSVEMYQNKVVRLREQISKKIRMTEKKIKEIEKTEDYDSSTELQTEVEKLSDKLKMLKKSEKEIKKMLDENDKKKILKVIPRYEEMINQE